MNGWRQLQELLSESVDVAVQLPLSCEQLPAPRPADFPIDLARSGILRRDNLFGNKLLHVRAKQISQVVGADRGFSSCVLGEAKNRRAATADRSICMDSASPLHTLHTTTSREAERTYMHRSMTSFR